MGLKWYGGAKQEAESGCLCKVYPRGNRALVAGTHPASPAEKAPVLPLSLPPQEWRAHWSRAGGADSTGTCEMLVGRGGGGAVFLPRFFFPLFPLFFQKQDLGLQASVTHIGSDSSN